MDAWSDNVRAQLRLLQATPSGGVEARGTFEKTCQLTRGLTQANLQYVYDVVRASFGLVTGSGTTAASTANAVQHDAEPAAKSAAETAHRFEDDGVDTAAELRNQRAQARRAKKAAHDAAAERYDDMTKIELSEELGNRGLKKSGNLDELRDRLVDNDLEDS